MKIGDTIFVRRPPRYHGYIGGTFRREVLVNDEIPVTLLPPPGEGPAITLDPEPLATRMITYEMLEILRWNMERMKQITGIYDAEFRM